ncbi:hypothetical protein ACQPZG_18790 [Streptomyces sp. CA-294286]|uniref:Uncharacterized protein n=1 Tax=Streptomyces candidus TaxID=67283 RepID=A0A7X0HDQ8_9ACTN|nr:hypothetical protein [Streptomyces candidus]MBB6435729.1 hypothetical protein [Streptomyces candidus]GHH46353.1 hypothetical protein GCM10018773_37190 [Streptomyces candidus]
MPFLALLALGAYFVGEMIEGRFGLLGVAAVGFLSVGVKTKNTACLSIGTVALVILGQSAMP